MTSGVESLRQPFEVMIINNTHDHLITWTCFGLQWLVSACFSEGRSRFGRFLAGRAGFGSFHFLVITYHIVCRTGKCYLTVFYESVLILIILHHIVSGISGGMLPRKFSKLGFSAWLKMNLRWQNSQTFEILWQTPWPFRQISWLPGVSLKFPDFCRLPTSVVTLYTRGSTKMQSTIHDSYDSYNPNADRV